MKTIGTDHEFIEIRSAFADYDVVRTLRAKWNPRTSSWSMPHNTTNVLRAWSVLSNLGYVQTEEYAVAYNAAVAQLASKTREDLAEFPGRMESWTHQRQAYHFTAGLSGSMLAMGMGTGKSKVFIGRCDGEQASFVTILCPRAVIGVWPKQFRLHSEREWNVVTWNPKIPMSRRLANSATQIRAGAVRRQPTAFVINYDAAWRKGPSEFLMQLRPDLLACDESHRIKSAGSKTSMWTGRFARKAKARVLMTGTPMPHSPLDVYGQYRAADPAIYGTSHQKFKSRYAILGGHEGRQVVGYQNEDELKARFHSIAYVCGDEVLDLPPVLDIEFPFALENKTRSIYTKLSDDFIAWVKTQSGADEAVTVKNAMTKLLRLQQVTSGHSKTEDGTVVHIAGYDQATSEPKPAEKEVALQGLLEDMPEREPVVVFCRFTEDLRAVERVASRLGRRYGELSGHRRDGITEEATMSPDATIMGVQIQSGGVGVDLTRAAYGVFYSIGFSLGDYMQARKRMHRPGQERPVRYYHLIADESVDALLYSMLDGKRDLVESIIDVARSTKAV